MNLICGIESTYDSQLFYVVVLCVWYNHFNRARKSNICTKKRFIKILTTFFRKFRSIEKKIQWRGQLKYLDWKVCSRVFTKWIPKFPSVAYLRWNCAAVWLKWKSLAKILDYFKWNCVKSKEKSKKENVCNCSYVKNVNLCLKWVNRNR